MPETYRAPNNLALTCQYWLFMLVNHMRVMLLLLSPLCIILPLVKPLCHFSLVILLLVQYISFRIKVNTPITSHNRFLGRTVRRTGLWCTKATNTTTENDFLAVMQNFRVDKTVSKYAKNEF